MEEAVVLANGKVIKKSLFDATPLTYHNNGFVKGFSLNGIRYIALFFGGDLGSYAGYYIANEYYRIVRDFDNKKIDRPKKGVKGHIDDYKLIETTFDKYVAKAGDIVQVQIRTISSNQLCRAINSWNYDGTKQYEIKNPISDSTQTTVNPPNCTLLTPEAQAIYNLASSRPADSQWDYNVVADIAEIIASLDQDIKSILLNEGLLTAPEGELNIYQRNSQDWMSNSDDQSYYFYTNERLIEYRDYLIKYKAWFLVNREKINTLTSAEKLYSVVGHFSARALEVLEVKEKIRILDVFCTKSILGYYLSPGEFNEEHIVLKVIKSVTAQQAYDFLTQLAKSGEYSSANDKDKTLFELLYRKIGDEGLFGLDDKNKFALINRLYLLWYISDYNPYEKYNLALTTSNTDSLYATLEDKIVFVPYSSKKSWGFYTDNMDFDFSDGKIETDYDFSNWQIEILSAFIKAFQGTNKYGYYQAVTFKNTDENEYAIQIPGIALEDKIPGLSVNTFAEGVNLPLFYLKYIDDYGDNEDLWTGVGLTLDIVLTFTGIGNLAKLRHLRHVTKLGRLAIGKAVPAAERILATQALRGITGALELTSSIASLILTHYTDGCQIYINNVNQNYNESNSNVEIPPQPSNPNYNWCRNLDRWLMAVQLVSGGVDLVSQRVLSKTSKQLIENPNDIPIDFPDDALVVISSYADVNGTFLTAFRQKRRLNITSELNNRIWKANLGKTSQKFMLSFSVSEIEDFVQYATNNNAKVKEISDFLFISARIEKPINDINVLKNQLSNWKNVIEPRRFPFKVHNLSDYQILSTRVKNLAINDFQFPSTAKFKVQGSSLRKLDSDDIDVAVFMTKKELDDFLATQLNIYKFRVSQSKKIKKYESNVKEAYNLGIIKPDWFKNANGKTLLDEAKNINIYNGVADYPSSKFNFSIIIRDGQYDVSPYLDL